MSKWRWATNTLANLHYTILYEKRKAWRYQRGNQNPYVKEEQTTQWPTEKVQKSEQRFTKHTHKTKDRVTRTPPKTGGELRCSGRVSSSCSTSGTRRVNLVTNPLISHEWGKHEKVFTTSGTYPWTFVTQIIYDWIDIYVLIYVCKKGHYVNWCLSYKISSLFK
jgi:hypothetical protein